jgi:hypothetical protein
MREKSMQTNITFVPFAHITFFVSRSNKMQPMEGVLLVYSPMTAQLLRTETANLFEKLQINS